MTQVIVFTNETGSVSVCYPTGEIPIEEVQAKDTPAGSVILDLDALPDDDNDFFNAWELVGDKVLVNFAKAQEVTKQRLREEREPLLQAQDIIFQRALESGADTSAIVTEKQRLRDVTALVNTVNTLDELRALSAANQPETTEE